MISVVQILNSQKLRMNFLMKNSIKAIIVVEENWTEETFFPNSEAKSW